MTQPFSSQDPQFDDALPKRVLEASRADLEQKKIALTQGNAPLSPYIVKISHATGELKERARIEEDADIFADEAPLVEYREGVLHFAEDAVITQILEDLPREDLPEIAPYPAVRTEHDHIPTRVFAVEDPVDIFQEILADHTSLAVLSQEEDAQENVQVPVQREHPVNEPEENPEPKETLLVFPLWKQHMRTTFAFAAIVVLVTLPFHASYVFADVLRTKAEVTSSGSAGLAQFLRGTSALQEHDFSQASARFTQATESFSQASESLADVHGIVATAVNIIPTTDRTATTANALLAIGTHVSRASALLSRGMEEVSTAEGLEVTDRLAVITAYIEEASPELYAAKEASARIDIDLVPANMQEQVREVMTLLPTLAESFADVARYSDTLGILLGSEESMRYMFAFQNHTELRPTGGFMGSFAEMTFHKGAIVEERIPGGGSYDVQGQLRAFVSAPGPLQILRARWEFQDANWFPDFPTSARKMLWFYQSAGGPSVDGVIALNATVMEDLLGVLGPLTLADGRVIDQENFLFETQKETEHTYDKEENAPKAIIGEMTNLVFARLKDADAATLVKVVGVFTNALSTREMQVYMQDNALQGTMRDLGWTGELRTPADDYLMVVHTNVGGGKTDAVLTRDVTMDVTIAEDGTIENTVTLTHTHNGMASSLFSGINNVDYVRLYVPKGSTFITGSGFEVPSNALYKQEEYPLGIDEDLALAMQNVSKDPITQTDIWEEQGKAVLGNWIQTAPGETQTVTFTYRLPWKAFSANKGSFWTVANNVLGVRDAVPYAVTVQKQSGVEQHVFVRVHPPTTFSSVWTSSGVEGNELFQEEQKQDIFAGWLFER